VDLTVLGAELLEKDIWYPTILGVLVVVAGIMLFCGSVYLLLATNMGARLGFLVSFTALMAFMVVLTSLWITTASPLNTLKGSIPKWEILQVVPSLDKAKVEQARDIKTKGHKVDTIEAANVKAAVDEALVTKVAIPTEKLEPDANKFALFPDVTKYIATQTYEIGGSNPSFLNFEFTHTPKFAVVQFCGTKPNSQPFGVAPDTATCAPAGTAEAKNNGFVILERNLGSVRLPPIVAWISAIVLFALGLLGLYWYEKDKRTVAATAGRRPARVPVPAKV
jgi:hypothetical protein